MSTKKSAAELKAEYEKALARAEQLKQKMKRATAAEEAKKKSELLQLVLEWAESYDAVGDIDGAIDWFQNKIEHVYYTGDESDWQNISISSYNECLTNATIHFISQNSKITTYTIDSIKILPKESDASIKVDAIGKDNKSNKN